MSYLRKVEMSLSLPEIKAWEANFGLGDDERTRSATDSPSSDHPERTVTRGLRRAEK